MRISDWSSDVCSSDLVGGVTVTNATLHNADQVARLDVRVGDTVIVRRAGDVIPDVVAVVPGLRPPDAAPWAMPAQSPVFGSDLVRAEGVSVARCTGELTCAVQDRRRLCQVRGAYVRWDDG